MLLGSPAPFLARTGLTNDGRITVVALHGTGSPGEISQLVEVP